MTDTIKYFMWGYQKHFQISLQVYAEELFDEIDVKLKPKVFLFGILNEERTDRHPICIEPEDYGYSVKAFEEMENLAQQLEKVDKNRNIFHTIPSVHENHMNRISSNAKIEAIKKILYKEDVRGGTEKFVSYPTYVDGFFVYIVLEIDKKALDNHYSLTKNKTDEGYKISRSFIESAIDAFLKETPNYLKEPNRGLNIIERSMYELLRESGKQFMYSISQAGENFNGLHGFYDACNAISSLKYEGAEGLGKMIVAKKNHSNVRLTLELKEPIKISDFRKVRKFLELSDDKYLIVLDSELIYGLGEYIGKYNPKEESLFMINFISHYKWEVLHDNNSMMVVEYEQPNIPKDRMDRDNFYADLKRIFNDIDKRQLDDLWDITNEATKQSHGTMLVISDNVEIETKRLCKQSFSLEPFKLTPNIVLQITSIDGAVFLDKNSFCHAVGVILDGLATDKGDSSRGARYNSAIRYYEQVGKNHPTVLIIISEDGMINLIPNLKPQINHSEIIEAIKSLEEMSKSEEVKIKYFNHLMSFFTAGEFYLTKEECEKINELRKIIEDNKKDISIHKVYRDLKPNDEMNESFYLD